MTTRTFSTTVQPFDPVVEKPINVTSGLKANQSFNFSCIKVSFSTYGLRVRDYSNLNERIT